MKGLKERRLDRLRAKSAELDEAVKRFKKAHKSMDPLSGYARSYLLEIQDWERILKRTNMEIAKLETKLGLRGQLHELDDYRKSHVG